MTPNESEWLVTHAVIQGTSHVVNSVPCQDACHCLVSDDGQWFAAVVCDGAGSAPMSGRGAALVAESFAQYLLALTVTIREPGRTASLHSEIQRALNRTRDKLKQEAQRSCYSIDDLKCTVVAALAGPKSGCLVHIGDGAALASRALVDDSLGQGNNTVSLWNDPILSEPENGDFANETFFITQVDWHKHLRTRALLGDYDIVVLTTDGAMPFLLVNGQPHSPFMDPVIQHLLKAPDAKQRQRLLRDFFSDPETHPISDDDRTILIALRRRLTTLSTYTFVPQPECCKADQLTECRNAEDHPSGPSNSSWPANPHWDEAPSPADIPRVERNYGAAPTHVKYAAYAALVMATTSMGISGWVYLHSFSSAKPAAAVAPRPMQPHDVNVEPSQNSRSRSTPPGIPVTSATDSGAVKRDSSDAAFSAEAAPSAPATPAVPVEAPPDPIAAESLAGKPAKEQRKETVATGQKKEIKSEDSQAARSNPATSCTERSGEESKECKRISERTTE